tara:strand:- start:291 stop:575 length:285 start_codon:yes stop_codon:yes gene_type:complete
MKPIIKALQSKLTLEEEFELEKQIQKINQQKSVKELRSYAVELLRTGCRQGHFISIALEIICDQQDAIFKLEHEKRKKKATFISRLRYVLFGKD